MIGALVVLSYVGFAFWCAAMRPRLALLLMVFLAPWGALYSDFGLWINAYQIMMLALLVCTFARSLRPGWTGRSVSAGRLFALFVVFVIANSLIQLARVPDVGLDTSLLRGPMARGIVQMLMFTFTVSPVVLVVLWMRTRGDIAAMARTYVLSALVLALIGWLQLLVWVATGDNPMPIGFFNSWIGGNVVLSEGIAQFGDLGVYRMNSFSGEPRSLGGALVFAMMIIQAVGATSTAIPRRTLLAAWMFLAFSTLATLSTTALIVWAVGSIMQFPLARLFGVRLRVSGARIALLLGAIMLPFGLAAAAIEASGFPIFDLLASRTIDRIDTYGAVEDFDLAIIDYFRANPGDALLGVGLGNAHLYAQRYIALEFQWYALGNIFTAKTQYLRLISEAGFVGLALFLLWYLVLLIDAAIAVRKLPALVAIMPIATMTMVVFLASGQYVAEFYLVAGALGALCGVARHDRNAQQRLTHRLEALLPQQRAGAAGTPQGT